MASKLTCHYYRKDLLFRAAFIKYFIAPTAHHLNAARNLMIFAFFVLLGGRSPSDSPNLVVYKYLNLLTY